LPIRFRSTGCGNDVRSARYALWSSHASLRDAARTAVENAGDFLASLRKQPSGAHGIGFPNTGVGPVCLQQIAGRDSERVQIIPRAFLARDF
ncbi:hypothetical protein ABTE82_18995, partial [Acinetobacter baumannii]